MFISMILNTKIDVKYAKSSNVKKENTYGPDKINTCMIFRIKYSHTLDTTLCISYGKDTSRILINYITVLLKNSSPVCLALCRAITCADHDVQKFSVLIN